MDKLTKSEVLKNIKPTKKEHDFLTEGANKIKRKLKRAANKLGLKCDVFIGGSFEKGTYLRGCDVDYFVRFDMKYEDSKLSHHLKAILNKAKIKHEKQKGSRDYFSGIFSPKKYKIRFEVVPVYKIRKYSHYVNSTDLSPMHVQFIQKKIEENPDLSDEIRIAKQFFKSKKLYGAEGYINGFSAHVIEILIIFYSSFSNLIKNAQMWDDETFIDINSHYKSFELAKNSIGYDKLSNLVVIDPIVKNRNCARALSEENYSKFIFECNRISSLSISDFKESKININEILESSLDFAKQNNLKRVAYLFSFKLENESFDIIGSKLKRAFNKTKIYFESFDFKIFHCEFEINLDERKCLFVFLFEKQNLPSLKKIEGPKVTMRDSIKKFLKNRDFYFVKDGRVCSYEKRRVKELSEIYKINLKDFEKMLNRDLSFVKKIRIFK